jgi:hypothetical protein
MSTTKRIWSKTVVTNAINKLELHTNYGIPELQKLTNVPDNAIYREAHKQGIIGSIRPAYLTGQDAKKILLYLCDAELAWDITGNPVCPRDNGKKLSQRSIKRLSANRTKRRLTKTEMLSAINQINPHIPYTVQELATITNIPFPTLYKVGRSELISQRIPTKGRGRKTRKIIFGLDAIRLTTHIAENVLCWKSNGNPRTRNTRRRNKTVTNTTPVITIPTSNIPVPATKKGLFASLVEKIFQK